MDLLFQNERKTIHIQAFLKIDVVHFVPTRHLEINQNLSI